MDPRRKIQGGLGLIRDRILNSLVPNLLLTTFLLGLGINRGPYAVAE